MLFLDEFYPAVLGATFVRAVGGDGLVGALADGGEAGFGNPLFYQGGHDGFGPLLTQRVIDFVGARGVAVALYLELQAGVILHQFGHTVYLHHGFGLEIGLSGLEGDGVGDNLALGHQTVVERHGALGKADIANAAVGVLGRAVEIEVTGRLHGRHIDDAESVDIALESPLVEGEGKMVPLPGLQGIVLSVVIAKAGVESQLFIACGLGTGRGLAKSPGHT